MLSSGVRPQEALQGEIAWLAACMFQLHNQAAAINVYFSGTCLAESSTPAIATLALSGADGVHHDLM